MLDKALKLCVVTLFVAVFLGGCAGTRTAVSHQDTPVRIDGEKIADDVAQKVMHADDLFNGGEYRAAERIYQDLLNKYSTKDSSFEAALLTNICLCRLETGERTQFKDCAERLKKTSIHLPYLSRETQMVLELNDMLGASGSAGKDVRIESRISNGLNEILKEGR